MNERGYCNFAVIRGRKVRLCGLPAVTAWYSKATGDQVARVCEKHTHAHLADLIYPVEIVAAGEKR